MNKMGGVLLGAVKTALLTFFTEKMILKLILDLLAWGAQQTTNKIDDKIVIEYESRLKESGVL